eukprot:7601720-Lingulodinium_polyedra.AAC.1
MAEATAKGKLLRTSGQNVLHIAPLVALSGRGSRRGCIIFAALAEMRLLHGQQVKVCQTVEGCRK